MTMTAKYMVLERQISGRNGCLFGKLLHTLIIYNVSLKVFDWQSQRELKYCSTIKKSV